MFGEEFFTGKGLELPREVWIPIPGGAQGIPGGGTESSGDKVGMGTAGMFWEDFCTLIVWFWQG